MDRGGVGISNTFSIVAVDVDHGLIGSAVASLFLGVGAVVPHLIRGVGAVNTQHHHQVVLAQRALALMEQGAEPDAALRMVLAGDTHPEERQLIAIDAMGRKAAHTGSACQEAHHHLIGETCVAAGNTLTGKNVIEAMVAAMDGSVGQPFGLRLVGALEAAQAAGGDKRGKQAAGLRIVPQRRRETVNGLWDLRVDDATEPIRELRRLVELRLAQTTLGEE